MSTELSSISSQATDQGKLKTRHAEIGHLDQVLEESEIQGAVDDAAGALAGQALEYTALEEKILVRKMDWIIVPILLFGAGIGTVDKATIGSAAALTMMTDLNLQGSQYSWSVSIYCEIRGLAQRARLTQPQSSVCFLELASDISSSSQSLTALPDPMSFLLQKYHSGRVAGITTILWGVLMLCTMAVKNFAQLAAMRFLLGICESAMPPALTLITARFYTQVEQPWRFSLEGLGNTFVSVPFTLMFYGIGRAQAGSLPAWRYLFCLMGCVSFVLGCVMVTFLPDKPSNTWWLSPRQRAIAVERIARQQTGIKSHIFRWHHVKEAVLDVKAWLLGLIWACQQAPVVVTNNFLSLIIKGFGFSGVNAILLTVPQWFCATAAVLTIGWLSSNVQAFRQIKAPILAGISVLTAISAGMVYGFYGTSAREKTIGLVFCTILGTNSGSYPIILALVGQNFAGATKKQATMVIVYSLYCVANLAIPQSFKASQAPRYHDGLITVFCCQAAMFVFLLVFFAIVRRENARRDRLQAESGADEVSERELVLAGLQDQTDKENPRFRYYA